MSAVQKNSIISIHYTAKNARGKILDTTVGKGAVEFVVGSNKMIPGINEAVLGMKEGEIKSIHLTVEKAYGEVNPDLQQEVSKSDLPEMNFRKGQKLMSENEDGSELPLTVFKVLKNSVVLDANHPLAGKELDYSIQIVEIIN